MLYFSISLSLGGGQFARPTVDIPWNFRFGDATVAGAERAAEDAKDAAEDT